MPAGKAALVIREVLIYCAINTAALIGSVLAGSALPPWVYLLPWLMAQFMLLPYL